MAMADTRKSSLLLAAMGAVFLAPTQTLAEDPARQVISVTRRAPNGQQQELTGRIHVEAQDGGMMLEDQTGCIHSITAAEILNRRTLEKHFEYLADERMAEHLLAKMGNSFAIHQTDHFVICSDASEVYTQYCGALLETVFARFQLFFEDSAVKLSAPTNRMQVIVFRSSATFQKHARQQHPETDFSDVPGYYSIRDNQMLITAVSGDRDFRRQSDLLRVLKKNLRQVETIVHECVHQLVFNTGLQKRYSEVPLWFSEGFAVYFEGTSGRGSLAWSRPGEASRIHLPTLKNKQNASKLRLATLLSSNTPFQDPNQLAAAYSQSWGLIHFLITRKRDNFDSLLQAYQQLKPRQTISAEMHLKQFETATNQPIEETARQLDQHISRLRVPR